MLKPGGELMDDFKRNKAEGGTIAANKDWESTFNNVTDSITIHDADFNIVHMNQSALELLGLQTQEGIPLAKCFRCYHGADKPPSDCPSCQTLKTGRPSTVERFEPFLNKHLEIRAMPRFGGDGQLVGLIHVVRDITDRKSAEKALQQAQNELEVRNKNLEEMNTALHVLLQKREEDKRQVEDLIVSNIKSLVLPYVEKMKKDSPDAKQQRLLGILEAHLNELLSPLLKKLQQFNLTPKEVQVAAMVKDGKTTKDIADILGVETSSIDDHRINIRKKLGLSRKVSLQSKLQTLN
jgi:PAS domain S-box-containing protein